MQYTGVGLQALGCEAQGQGAGHEGWGAETQRACGMGTRVEGEGYRCLGEPRRAGCGQLRERRKVQSLAVEASPGNVR